MFVLNRSNLFVSLSVSIAVSIASAVSFWYYKYYKANSMPKKWRRIGILSQIYFYPLKSCGAIEIEPDCRVLCDFLGLRYDGLLDRAFLVVDMKNEIQTARTYHKMYQIQTKKIGKSKVRLTAPGMPELELDYAKLLQDIGKVQTETVIWGSNVFVKFCGIECDRWFSKFLMGKEDGLKLAYYPHLGPTRPVSTKWDEPYLTANDTGTFAEFSNYILMNMHSIDDLNRRLEKPVDKLHFRGNFYIKLDNQIPYAENIWDFVKIGDDAVFRSVLPCTRSVLPNVSVDGQRDAFGNPLKSINPYCDLEKYISPVFGIHLGLRRSGHVQVGDVIYIEDDY